MAKTANRKRRSEPDLDMHYEVHVKRMVNRSAWVLRITDQRGKPSPVFIVKERISPDDRDDTKGMVAPRSVVRDRGLIYGETQLRCMPVFRNILSRQQNEAGISLDLHQYLDKKGISFRGNLPLDAEAGCKIALIFKLRERIKELDRVELLARRIDRFTREEAAYWFSRIANFGEVANRWAMAGMKLMLAGQPGDDAIQTMLSDLRENY